uniref:Costars domain-containing protein n=1 Tax=Rhabditophanes sp. KR3021 TaxID=114890 RepID=A0AC35UC75_9BILA
MVVITRNNRGPLTVIIEMTVRIMFGEKPIVGFSVEVEEAWMKLKRKFRAKPIKKSSHILRKVTSASQIDKVVLPKEKEVPRSSSITSMNHLMSKFKTMEQKAIASKKDDVFCKGYKPQRLSKDDPEYGTPKKGSLTELRAKKASDHIAKEMGIVCQVIEEYGEYNKDTGKIEIKFGQLFHIYQFISDKVVGMLLRARKHKMVSFETEMLYQGRDDHQIISLLIDHDAIIKAAS